MLCLLASRLRCLGVPDRHVKVGGYGVRDARVRSEIPPAGRDGPNRRSALNLVCLYYTIGYADNEVTKRALLLFRCLLF